MAWRRLPRAVRILLWIPIGLELFYLVAANAFLNLNVLPIAFAGTNQIKATLAGGWTLIPERVHVRNVRVTNLPRTFTRLWCTTTTFLVTAGVAMVFMVMVYGMGPVGL